MIDSRKMEYLEVTQHKEIEIRDHSSALEQTPLTVWRLNACRYNKYIKSPMNVEGIKEE